MELEQPEPETIGDEAAETEVHREFLAPSDEKEP
jgi:hypothetical protein